MRDKIDALHKKIDFIYFKIRMMKEEFEFLSDERQRYFRAKLINGMKEVVNYPPLIKGLREKLGNDFVEKILSDAAKTLDDVPVEESQWKFLFERTVDDIVKLYLEQIRNYTKLKELKIEDGEFSDSAVYDDEPRELIDKMIDNHRNVIKLYEKSKRRQEDIKW